MICTARETSMTRSAAALAIALVCTVGSVRAQNRSAEELMFRLYAPKKKFFDKVWGPAGRRRGRTVKREASARPSFATPRLNARSLDGGSMRIVIDIVEVIWQRTGAARGG
jgi:hypothetical protein